jgi:hypothetical protein
MVSHTVGVGWRLDSLRIRIERAAQPVSALGEPGCGPRLVPHVHSMTSLDCASGLSSWAQGSGAQIGWRQTRSRVRACADRPGIGQRRRARFRRSSRNTVGARPAAPKPLSPPPRACLRNPKRSAGSRTRRQLPTPHCGLECTAPGRWPRARYAWTHHRGSQYTTDD